MHPPKLQTVQRQCRSPPWSGSLNGELINRIYLPDGGHSFYLPNYEYLVKKSLVVLSLLRYFQLTYRFYSYHSIFISFYSSFIVCMAV